VIASKGLSGTLAAGRARRVGSAADLAALGADDVVVAVWLPPSWVPLLPPVAAVVLGTGGVLSNTAIVLRERGIPAVVGLGDQIDALQPGEPLVVDGAAGTVRRLARA
jgi:pyruvate,water dikinase